MSAEPITRLLEAARSGDHGATNALFAAVYKELQTLAQSQRRRWYGNHTMNTTALVHEAFIKLAGPSDFANRAHFFATASKAMRQILVNYAQAQKAEKRGGDAVRIPLEEATVQSQMSAEEMLDLHRVLTRLEERIPRRAHVAECRIFGGMTVEEIADALEISTATVKREWQIAAAQIYSELKTD
jgi:RNA polymerase sigma factor (TIGR02999 family)